MNATTQRRLSAPTTIVLAVLAALAVAPFLMNWLVLEVHTAAPDRVDLFIPMPLTMARLALRAIPAEKLDARVPSDIQARRAQVLAMLDALRQAPDTTFVSVDSPDATVRIAKRGDLLTLDVQGDHDGTVHGTLPIAALHSALARWDWRSFHPAMALDVPAASRRPPPAPPSGPRSSTQSQHLMTSRLCSTTTTE
jgi:hypothetical protein